MYVIAHRGLSHDYPENTLLAFQKAIELGVDMFELDVRKSKDEKLVISHDEDFSRSAHKPGKIKDFTFEEMQQFDLGMNQTVPLLSDVLKLIQNKEILLNIELKEYETEEEIVNMVKKYEVESQILFSSFKFPTLLEIRDLLPNATICTVTGHGLKEKNLQVYIDQAKMVQAKYMNINFSLLTRNIIDSIHAADLEVMAWNVDSATDMIYLIESGVDGIFSNEATRLKQIKEKHSKK
jgi:glycerophosphoryl diester phosphodiesterase